MFFPKLIAQLLIHRRHPRRRVVGRREVANPACWPAFQSGGGQCGISRTHPEHRDGLLSPQEAGFSRSCCREARRAGQGRGRRCVASAPPRPVLTTPTGGEGGNPRKNSNICPECPL